MKKLLLNLFFAIVMLVVGMGNAYAETEESPSSSLTKDVDIVGVSYTLPGTYIAGSGSKKGDMPNNGVKFRTNKTSNTVVFNVNAGYVITGIKFVGFANDAGTIDVVSAYVDGDSETNVLPAKVTLPANTEGKSVAVTISDIEAKSSVTLAFDNSNVVKNNQWSSTYVITYKEAIETAATPSISIVDGTVTITTNEAGATTYYTTDGSVPTTTSTVYTEPFTVTEGTMVKAYSVKDGMKDSKIASNTYSSFAPITAVFGLTRQIASESTTSSDGIVSGYALAADEVVDPAVEQVSIVMNYPASLSGLTDKGRNVYHGSTKCYVDKGVTNYRNTTKTLGDDYYQFDLTIADGYQLSLTQLVSDICKDSDKSQYQVVILQNGIAVYTGSTVSVNKSDNAKKTVDLSGEDALQSLQGTVSVKMLWTNTGNTGKYIALKDLNVTGVVSKAPIVTTYTVSVSVNPAEAGTVAQNGTSFAAGKDVVLTATPNVGYEFSHWTDAEESSVSTNTTYEFSMPAEDLSFTAHFNKLPLVTYSIAGMEGLEGLVPASEYGKSVTIPTNKTLYKEGYTLTGWTDGNTTYNIGAQVSITEDVTLTPVFTANTVSLANREYGDVTANWYLGQKNGAPDLNYQGKDGILVTQVSVEGVAMDLKLDLIGENGKINNIGRSDEWAQVNNGSQFVFPSCQGAVVTMTANNAMSSTTIEGSTDYTEGKTISYTIVGTDAEATIAVGEDARYISLIKVVYPATADWETVTKENGSDKNVDNVGDSYTVPGTYIAGGESGNNISDGLKIRTGQTAGEVKGFRITPNPGYKLKHIRLVGNSNYDEAVTIEGVYADGDYVNNIISESLVLTDKSATSACNLLIKNVNAVNAIDFACSGASQANLLISVCYEPIEAISLSINESGYSTFYANHAVAVPAGLTAYVGELTDAADYLNLVELTEGYIPAQTGVVIAGDKGTYDMEAYTSATEAVASDLSGVAVRTAATNFSGTIYALATIDSETAFYQYTGSYIPANKAFLVIPAAAAAPKVRIAGAVTGIESVTVSQDAAAGIYNLSGQRVKEMTAPGLYIVGGKKVLVK